MSDASNVAKSLRERLSGGTEDRLGKALGELLENPLLTGAIGRAFDAREKAAQAQEVAMGALNLPSAADIERLTRRLRSVSHRLEGIEDGVDRLDRALSPSGVEERLSAIEAQLQTLIGRLDDGAEPRPARPASMAGPASKARPARKARVATKTKPAAQEKQAGKAKPAGRAKAKPASRANAKAAGKAKAKAASRAKAKPEAKA
jgi:hypothetical protein